MPKFTDVMLDIETLGNAPGCVVFAIGAVPFTSKTGDIGIPSDSFYRVINVANSRDYGLLSDCATLEWWNQQSEEARSEFYKAHGDEALALPRVLKDFSQFILSQAEGVKVWGKGPSFDCSILRAAYSAVRLPIPWDFWNERCVRTIYDSSVMGKRHINFPPKIPHHALYDAHAQAVNVCSVIA